MAADVNLTKVNTFRLEAQGIKVLRFKGSGVQGSIRVPGLRLGCVFMRKASTSSGLIENVEPNWQLFR